MGLAGMTASVFPMAVIVPARTKHEETPLFLEPLGDKTIIDRTLDDAERQGEHGDAILILTTDDVRIKTHVEARNSNWLTRLRPIEETSGSYFHSLETTINWASQECNKTFASVLIFEPSHPFRPAGLVRNAIDIFDRSNELDTVVSVVREYGNLWTDNAHGGLNRIHTAEGRNFFREIAGLCLLTRPQCINHVTAMGQDVGFVVVEEEWALIDIHDRSGVAMAQRFFDFLIADGKL